MTLGLHCFKSSQSFPRVTAIHVVVVIVGAFVGSAGFGFSDVIVNICLNVLWTNNLNEEALLQSLLCLLLMWRTPPECGSL